MVLGALLLGGGVGAQPEMDEQGKGSRADRDDRPEEVFYDELTVSELSVVLRVVDSHGAPVLGLEAGDLRVTVGGKEVPVAGLTWHSSDASTFARERASPEQEIGPRAAGSGRPGEPERRPELGYEEDGKLVVVFVQMGHDAQVTLDESWVGGYMKVLPSLRRLVRGLPARDRVAVVSFDSRLKLRQDFSRDREATAERLGDALGFSDGILPGKERGKTDGPSLLEAWDAGAAADATSPEEALWVLGRALEPLPGPKEVLFVGWGLGRLTGGFVTRPSAYYDAVASLLRAEATVHGLNVVEADWNALSVGVRGLTETTGGTYAATFRFGRTRVEELGRTLAGYYLLTLAPGDFPGVHGRLEVRLRKGIEGRDVRVHHRELTLRASPAAGSR